MRITDVRTVLLTGPLTNDPSVLALRTVRSAAFVELHTDSSLVGLGETYLGYQFPEAVPPVVEFFAPLLLDADAEHLDIHGLRQRMVSACTYWGRAGVAPAVISAIEAALWDLKGKVVGLPVYELLGGKYHDRLPVYATGAPSNWPLDRLLAKVDHYLALGFHAFKIATGSFNEATGQLSKLRNPTEIVEFEAAKMEALRQHVGDDVEIMLDGHMAGQHGPECWDLSTAQRVLRAVEPYNPFFFEEPLPYTDPHAWAALRRSTSVRVAGGELLSTVGEFRQFAEADSFDIAQPDAAWLSLTDFLTVSRMFGERQRGIAAHAWGAGVATMQNVHAAFATPNVLILEMPPDAGPLHTDVWGASLRLVDGHVLPPTAPGLGATLTDELKEKYPFVPGSGETSALRKGVAAREADESPSPAFTAPAAHRP